MLASQLRRPLEGLLDRALLCFGFARSGCRRNEIAAANLRDLCEVGEYGYRLEYSKTQESGVKADSTAQKPIPTRSWLVLPCCRVRRPRSSNDGRC